MCVGLNYKTMSKPVCNHCAEDIEVVDSAHTVTCFVCEKSFHGFLCINLTKPQLKMIKDVKGLLWSCEHCSITTFPKYVCSKLNDIALSESTVKSHEVLLSRIELLTSEVSKLKKNFDSFSDSDDQIGVKRFRTGRPLTPRSNSSRFEWPPKVSTSTVASSSAINSTNSETTTLKVIEAPTYYHVSRFSTETSEDELQSWISEKLNVTADHQPVKCTKLVPRGRELSSLEFVSFKVSIPKIFEEKVMDASIWPTNITVRPFEQRAFLPRNYLWIPGRS